MSQLTPQQTDRLMAEQGPALVLYARQWCRDPDDAVQEALVELIRLAATPHDPIAWLFTTTKRRAMNQSRSQGRRRNRNQRAGESKSEASGAWFVVQLEKQEEAEQLQQHLEQLEPLEREIVVAHVWGELTFVQIAELVAVSSSTAHRHYQTALAKLKQAWNEPSGNTGDPAISAIKDQSAIEPRPNPSHFPASS